MYCVLYILMLSSNAPVHSRAPVKVYGKMNVCTSDLLAPHLFFSLWTREATFFRVSLFKKSVS